MLKIQKKESLIISDGTESNSKSIWIYRVKWKNFNKIIRHILL